MLAKVPHATNPCRLIATTCWRHDLSTTAVNQYNARIDHTFSPAMTASSFADRSSTPTNSIPSDRERSTRRCCPALDTTCERIRTIFPRPGRTSSTRPGSTKLRFGWLWVGGGQSQPKCGNEFCGTDRVTRGDAPILWTRDIPQATITGFSTMGESTQYVSRRDNNYEFYDNVIWHHGTHTVKFGGYFFHLNFDPVNAQQCEGHVLISPADSRAIAWAISCSEIRTRGRWAVQGRGTLLGRTNWVALLY